MIEKECFIKRFICKKRPIFFRFFNALVILGLLFLAIFIIGEPKIFNFSLQERITLTMGWYWFFLILVIVYVLAIYSLKEVFQSTTNKKAKRISSLIVLLLILVVPISVMMLIIAHNKLYDLHVIFFNILSAITVLIVSIKIKEVISKQQSYVIALMGLLVGFFIVAQDYILFDTRVSEELGNFVGLSVLSILSILILLIILSIKVKKTINKKQSYVIASMGLLVGFFIFLQIYTILQVYTSAESIAFAISNNAPKISIDESLIRVSYILKALSISVLLTVLSSLSVVLTLNSKLRAILSISAFISLSACIVFVGVFGIGYSAISSNDFKYLIDGYSIYLFVFYVAIITRLFLVKVSFRNSLMFTLHIALFSLGAVFAIWITYTL